MRLNLIINMLYSVTKGGQFVQIVLDVTPSLHAVIFRPLAKDPKT